MNIENLNLAAIDPIISEFPEKMKQSFKTYERMCRGADPPVYCHPDWRLKASLHRSENHYVGNDALVLKPGPCREEPPFWWLSRDVERVSREPESGDFYTLQTDFKKVEKYDVMGEMKLNDPEEYIPGEIYQSQKPHHTIAAFCQPLVQWTPKSPDFYKPFDINSVPLADNYLYRMVKKRQQLDLASTLREDSDYSLKDEPKMDRVGRPVHSEVTQLQALPSGMVARQTTRLCTEQFFCDCHQHHSLPKSNLSSKLTVCEKCGCEYNLMDPTMIDASVRIMAATNSHIAATNPYCFRDVIGRN